MLVEGSGPPPPPQRSAASASHRKSPRRTQDLALHRSARKWLDHCANTSSVESDLPSSEYWRERRSFLFYKHLHCVLQKYAAEATSALDVGSSLPPFLNTLTWIRNKTIVGPKFAGNVKKGGGEMLPTARIEEKFRVTAFQEDFMTWEPPGWHGGAITPAMATTLAVSPPYDLVLCSEVIEHVPQPQDFVQKLLGFGRVVVIATPFLWDGCEKKRCHHKTNKISKQTIRNWAGRSPQAFDIVEERGGERRIIVVYLSQDHGEEAKEPSRSPHLSAQGQAQAQAPPGLAPSPRTAHGTLDTSLTVVRD